MGFYRVTITSIPIMKNPKYTLGKTHYARSAHRSHRSSGRGHDDGKEGRKGFRDACFALFTSSFLPARVTCGAKTNRATPMAANTSQRAQNSTERTAREKICSPAALYFFVPVVAVFGISVDTSAPHYKLQQGSCLRAINEYL